MPWRDNGDPHRRAHFWYLRWWYTKHGFHVIAGDRPGEFNRAAARNYGVAQATSDVIAVVDADNLIPALQLDTAAKVARLHGGLVKPFSLFGYLSQEATDHWYATGRTDVDPKWEGDGPATGFAGGAYVMRRQDWATVGGMDDLFNGWGAEDDAFTIRCRRLLGPERVVDGYDLHLWHPTPGRMTSPENYQRLMEVYVRGNQPS